MNAVAKNWKNIHNEIRTGYVIETVAIHSTCGQQIPGIKHWQDKNSVVFCCSTCEFDNFTAGKTSIQSHQHNYLRLTQKPNKLTSDLHCNFFVDISFFFPQKNTKPTGFWQ